MRERFKRSMLSGINRSLGCSLHVCVYAPTLSRDSTYKCAGVDSYVRFRATIRSLFCATLLRAGPVTTAETCRLSCHPAT